MFGNLPFGFQLLRKYTAAFGTIFSNIQIVREDPSHSGNFFPTSVADEGDVEQLIRVPLVYAAKDKLLARVAADPTITDQSALTLPRIAFQMKKMDYKSERKLRSVQRFKVTEDTTTQLYKEILDPVPYDLHFTVWVATKYQMEGNQIIEQILPYFTPTFPLKLDLIPEMGIVVDAPIILNSVNCEDNYEGNYEKRRAIIWTLEFTMVAYLYGPIRKHPIIKFANVSFYDATRFDNIGDAVGNTAAIDRVTVQPGLDANGNPTTNVALSVDYHTILANSNWGYIVDDYGDLDKSEDTGGTVSNNLIITIPYGLLGAGYNKIT